MLRLALDLVDIRKFDRNARLYFVFGIPYFSGMALFGLLYNLYLLRLGYREDFIGLLAGMTPLAAGVFAILIGILSDRYGRKPFLIGSSLAMILSQAGLCFTTERVPLILFGFLGGLSTAMIFVNHVPFLAENCRPRDRGKIISLGFALHIVTSMLVSLGGGALPGLFGKILALGPDRPEPFRYTLLIGLALTAISILPLLRIREEKKLEISKPSSNRSKADSPSDNSTPWGLLLVFAAISSFRGMSFGLSYPFFNVFFQEELGATAATIGAIFFCSRALSMIGILMSPKISGRLGAVATIAPLRLLTAVSLALLGVQISLPLSFLLFSTHSASDSMATPTEMTLANNVVSRSHWGRAQSVRVMGYQLLSAAGSILAGNMIPRLGYFTTFAVAALLIFASGTLLLGRFGWHYRGPERETS